MNPIIFGVGALLLGVGAKKIANRSREAREERNRRRSTPLRFPEGMSQQDFEGIVRKQAATIKRIRNVNVSGADISCTVMSQSGISVWSFTIDMNDYGNLVGDYWIESQNRDSNIPTVLASRIQGELLGIQQQADVL